MIDGMCQLHERNSNCGDSIIAKFNSHQSYSMSCVDRIGLSFVHVKRFKVVYASYWEYLW